MRARPVAGLDPDGTLVDNARRTVLVRLDELYSFAGASRRPEEVEALHDMRIAAKRLRYILEITGPCFGETARRGAKQAKELQSLLGEIHDCDELLPLVRAHVKRLRSEDAAAVRSRADDGADDLQARAARSAPHRGRYRGLEALHSYLEARRDVLHARFVREWAAIEERDFRAELERSLDAATMDPGPGSEEGIRLNGSRC